MSGSENGGEPLEHKTLAFEYVTGSLSPDEKRDVRARLNSDQQLQEEVRFWEQQLMNIHPDEERPPHANTWNNISDAITPKTRPTAVSAPEPVLFDWKALLQWGSPTIAAVALMLVLFGYYPGATGPNNTSTAGATDYVAVLTDADGRAQLTAISAANEKNMRLKWEARDLKPDTNMQLWAISKRDGEARPITIFTDTSVKQLPLDTAQWRLVTDADFLLLTEEEPGGSAIDEPSDIQIAKGVCVRFSPEKPTS